MTVAILGLRVRVTGLGPQIGSLQWFFTNLPAHERDLTIILGTNIFDHADVTKEPSAIINTSLFSSPLIIVKVQYQLKIIIIAVTSI